MKSSSCNQCGKTYASSQSLWNHKQRCKKSGTSQPHDLLPNYMNKEVSGQQPKGNTHTSLKSIVPSPKKMDYAENDEFLQDIESPDRDIPTFDGAEFCGDKPLSDDTLLRMMENLDVPPDRRARNLELFRKDQERDKKVREKMKNSCNVIDTLDSKQDGCPTRQVKSLKAYKDLSEQEKTLVDKFNQLLREMEVSGKDNGEELCVILNKLRNTGILDEETSQRLFNVMEDIHIENEQKSVHKCT